MRIRSNPALPLALAIFFTVPALAQKGGGRGGGIHSAPPATPPTSYTTTYKPTSSESEFNIYDVTAPGSPPQKFQTEQPPCFHWPMNPILSATLNAGRMEIPAKAQAEFSDGCTAVRSKNFASAQEHLKQAVKMYPRFAVAWALLGQTEKDQGQNDEAAQSCTRAREADSSYLPSYLCLADLAARRDKWAEVADLTNQVLGLHPIKAPAAFYYNCLANFYLKQLAIAEQSALRAITEGPKAYEPQVRWLLAKIYEEKGERVLEAEQLREYLKLAPHAADSSLARHILQEIETGTADGSSATVKAPKKNY